MMKTPLRFLFIPVSSVKGIGEYMRSLILATEIKRRWPEAEIKFILNRHAKYASYCPFDAELLEHSPTKHTADVNRIIDHYLPNVVVFDASGRQTQFVKAKAVGAITVFISQHKKKRRRGMALKRVRFTDFHFVAQPEFAIAPLNFLEKLKFKLLMKPVPECVGILFNQPTVEQSTMTLKKFGVEKDNYLIISAGSGGHKHYGKLVADIFYDAAEHVAQKTGLKTFVVMGSSYPNAIPTSEHVTVISSLDNAQFITLLEHAKAAILSGGGALLQALSLQTPVIACPVSKDQPARIKACVQRRIVSSISLEQLVDKAPSMLNQENLQQLQRNLQLQPSNNGVTIITERLAQAIASNNEQKE